MVTSRQAVVISLIAFAICLGHAAEARDEKPRPHYDAGVALLEQGDTHKAIEEFRAAVHEDYKFADAHARLAEAYFRLNTIEARRLAAEAYELAIRYDPQNADYHLALGRVQAAQSFDRYAEKSFLKTIEVAPERPEAYVECGAIYIRRWRDQDKDLRKAYDLLVQGYDKGSTDRDLLYTLGRVSNELEEYGMAEEALLRILVDDPSDTEALFQYGAALQGRGKLEEAEEAYWNAILETSRESRALFLGIDGYAENLGLGSGEADAAVVAEFGRRLWRNRDPDLSTEANERLLEHWRRILQADLRFEAPRAGLRGRDSARGQSHIRYGPPLERASFLDETKRKLRKDEIALGMEDDQVERNPRPVEVWTYEMEGKHFQLTFRDRFLDGQFGFAFDEGRTDARRWETMIREIPEFHLPLYEGTQIRMIADACSFLRDPGITRQEIYYAVPAEDLGFVKEGDVWTEKLLRRILIYNEDWEIVARETTTVITQVSGTLTNVRRGALIHQSDYNLLPGRYLAAISVEDEREELIGLTEVALDVRAFDSSSLMISDIQLARAIRPSPGRTPFDKGDLTVEPEPTRRFRRAKPVHFYYEVYGLALDGSGRSSFKATVRVIPIDVEDAGGLWEGIRRLFRRKPSTPPHIANTFTYEGASSFSPRRLSLDLAPLRFGRYVLTLSIQDTVAGTETGTSTTFYVTR